MKLKNEDRARGTSPAVLRSSGPKQRPERVATTLGVSGESIRRDVPSNDMIAYMAGLFDGEGCVTYKKYWSNKRENRPRKYYCWRIQLEIVMTDEATIQWCCDHFGGRCIKKPRKEYKMQYRWRRGFKHAYEIASAIYPYAVTKKAALKDIIKHYDNKEMDSKNEDVVRRSTRSSRKTLEL